MKKALVGLILLIVITGLVILQKTGNLGIHHTGDVVAHVGNDPIITPEMISEMVKRYHSKETAQKQNISARLSVLNNMIETKLKSKMAKDLGIADRPDMKKKLDKYKSDAANAELYKKLIVNHVITEQAIQEYYQHDGKEVKARHILLNWPKNATHKDSTDLLRKAEDISARAKAGEPFDDLVVANTEEPGGAERKGDLGWFGWGRMVPPFQETVWNMKKGEISDPVKTRFGYHIIRLDDIRKKSQQPLEEMRDDIKQTLIRMKRDKIGTAVQEHFDFLRKKHNLTYTPNLDTLLTLLNAQSNPGANPLSTLDEKVKSMVIATSSDEQITVNDLDTHYGEIPNAPKKFSTVQQLKDLLDSMFIPKFLTEESKEYGLYDNPEVISNAESRWTADLDRVLESEEITNKIKLDDSTLETYFDEHKNNYKSRPRVEVQEIFVSDKKLADRIASKVKSGANFGKMAKKYTERQQAKENNGVLSPFTKGRYGAMGKAAFLMKVGEISNPIALGSKYSIIKVLKKYPPTVMTFDEAKRQVRTDLEKQSHDNLLKQLLDRARKTNPVTVDTMKVKKLFM